MNPTVIDFSQHGYFLVTVPGRGDLCRTFADAGDAIDYARSIRAW